MTLLERAILQAKKNQIANFDSELFERNQHLLFILADMIDGISTDMISQMEQVGVFKFEDKKRIEAIKKNASLFVGDLDRTCSYGYACTFGEVSDEVKEAIYSLTKDKRTLEHENRTD